MIKTFILNYKIMQYKELKYILINQNKFLIQIIIVILGQLHFSIDSKINLPISTKLLLGF